MNVPLPYPTLQAAVSDPMHDETNTSGRWRGPHPSVYTALGEIRFIDLWTGAHYDSAGRHLNPRPGQQYWVPPAAYTVADLEQDVVWNTDSVSASPAVDSDEWEHVYGSGWQRVQPASSSPPAGQQGWTTEQKWWAAFAGMTAFNVLLRRSTENTRRTQRRFEENQRQFQERQAAIVSGHRETNRPLMEHLGYPYKDD